MWHSGAYAPMSGNGAVTLNAPAPLRVMMGHTPHVMQPCKTHRASRDSARRRLGVPYMVSAGSTAGVARARLTVCRRLRIVCTPTQPLDPLCGLSKIEASAFERVGDLLECIGAMINP